MSDNRRNIIIGAVVIVIVLLLLGASMQESIDTQFVDDYGTDYGIVLSLDFEEGTGTTAFDQSPYGNDGVITGATWSSGKFGEALTFDGNDYVSISESDSLDISDNITIEAWAKDPPIPFGAELGGDFEIVGDTVMVNDSRVYLSADPHTITSSGWVEFTLISKIFTGDIDVVWGFNMTESRPTKPQIWRNYTHTLWRWVETEETYFNETTGETFNYTGHEKEYYESTFFDWKPMKKIFDKRIINAKGMNTWYILKNVNVVEGKEYRIRCWVDIPFAGLDTVRGKYAWGVKLSSDTIREAIDKDKFYFMDPWYDSRWLYRIGITIDSGDIGGVLSDFPVMVYLNSSRIDWARVRDNLDDIRFTSDDEISLLNYEIENYVVNDEAWLWVRIPSVSNIVDTDFYMYYGNILATSGENKIGTWEDGYIMVQHMVDNTTSTVLDSTQYDNDGVKKGANEPLETAVGKIDSAQDFDGTDDYVTVLDDNELDTNLTYSVFVWIKVNSVTGYHSIVTKYSWQGVDQRSWRFETLSDRLHLRISPTWDGTGEETTANPSFIVVSTWYYVGFTYDGADIRLYVDGVPSTVEAYVAGTYIGTADVVIGAINEGLVSRYNGTIDEVRMSNVTLSPSWIKASYESERDDLLTYSSEEYSIDKMIVEKYGSYALGISDTSMLVGMINETVSTYEIDTVTDWHYYAMTYDGANIRLYIDGVLVNTTVATGSIRLSGILNVVDIGTRFLGEIDQVRIYKVVKTVGEIRNHYINSGGMYSGSVIISDDFRILNTTLDEQLRLMKGHPLYIPFENWIHFDSVGGAVRDDVFHLEDGSTTQNRRVTRLIVGAHPAPGGGKWLNVSISDGTNYMWVNMTGATEHGYTTTGAFDLDVSAETLEIRYDLTAGGTTDHVSVVVQWYYKDNG